MRSLTLKNLPDDLLDALRCAAARDRRSVTQQIIHLLEVALRDEQPSKRSIDVDAQVDAWRKLAGSWEANVTARTETKRIMERRTDGRKVDL